MRLVALPKNKVVAKQTFVQGINCYCNFIIQGSCYIRIALICADVICTPCGALLYIVIEFMHS